MTGLVAKRRTVEDQVSLVRKWIRRLPRGSTLAVVFVFLISLAALLAPLLPVADPTSMDVAQPIARPSAAHLLGTDTFGRDLLSRLVWGSRISLVVAFASVALGGAAGVIIGLVASNSGVVVDGLLMRLMDALFTFPSLLLAVALIGAFGRDASSVVIALAVVFIPSFARQVRADALSALEREYVQAARALGAGSVRVLCGHVLPNIAGPLVVRGTIFLSYAIVAESSLSFLGLGAQPPTPTWGSMLSEARPYLLRAPTYPLVIGTAILMTVLAFNKIGDAATAVLNPRSIGKQVSRR